MKKTIFLDIDGCIFKHNGNLTMQMDNKPELLDDVISKLNQWEGDGHRIILVTGRKESMRNLTEKQLSEMGVFYDQMVMGLNRGERILINDKKPNIKMTVASAIEINRNEGLTNIEI